MLTLLYPSKIYKLLLISTLFFFFPRIASAQNLFLQKIDICNTEGVCMDCGDTKATCDQFTLDYICDRINRRYVLKDAQGSITFQVLVEPSGFSCVISHTDVTNSALTAELIRYLNGNIWRPATINGKPVFSSVNVIFRFVFGGISAHMLRMDLSEMTPPGNPVIYNTSAVYSNPSLKNYDFTVWTKYNSPLPDNISKSCVIDKTDILWYASIKGLTRFDGQNFNPVNEYNSPFTTETAVNDLTVDKEDNKWIYVDGKMFKYTTAGWQLYDFKKFLSAGLTHILNSRNGELLFTTKDGLVVLRKDKVVVLNKKTLPALPSSNVLFAFDDSQKRLWIGTSKGSIMIDKGLITTFNATNTPLKNTCITGATEDENGNLYLSMVSCNKAADDVDNDKEGIALLKNNGGWVHFNDKNSGMPSNHVNDMLYDKHDHALWIGTDQSGIVRYSAKDGWENYHNNNSPVPGFAIYQLVQDSKGAIYAATANGLLRIKRK